MFQLIVAIWSNRLFIYLETFLFFKAQKRHHTVSENIQSKFTDAVQCGMFNAISKKHFRYSQFVKRIIAIEAQLHFLGLVGL